MKYNVLSGIRICVAFANLIGLLAAVTPLVSAQAIRSNGGFRSNSLPRDDDNFSAAAPIGFEVNLFGVRRTTVYVNNNGNITFDSPNADYTPEALRNNPRQIIAPFFSDVDTRGARSAQVTYGQDTVDGRRAFAANYTNVGYFRANDDKLNSFQVALIERGDTGTGNFDIEFNYQSIVWEVGDADLGNRGLCPANCRSASAGYSNGLTGASNLSFEVSGSLVPGSFLDSNASGLIRRTQNSSVPGRQVFQVRNGVVLPSISSLNPSSRPAGSAAFTLQIIGSNFANGNSVRWTAPNGTVQILTATFRSATLLETAVSQAMLTTAGTAQVAVLTSGGAASNQVGFPITSVGPPTIISLNPASRPMGSAGFTLQINGSNFASGSTVSWTPPNAQPQSLAAVVRSAALIETTIAQAMLALPGTAQVTVVGPNGAASNPASFSITGGPGGPGGPVLIRPVPRLPPSPTEPVQVTIQLDTPAASAYRGTLALTFAGNAAGLPPNYIDPAMQFASGGRTLPFDIPAGATSAVLPGGGNLQMGTVAGMITITVTELRQLPSNTPVPFTSQPMPVPVEPKVPAITPSSVRITDATGSGFTVEATGYATTRDLIEASVSFGAGAGGRLDGTTTFPIPLGSTAASWFSASAGLANGSRFNLRIPFTYSGDPAALGTVTLSLRNSMGASSAVSGPRQ